METVSNKTRYAVVGLGWIAQAAVLPAFRNANKNSELVALVSGDPEKLQKLGADYGVAKENQYAYERYGELLRSGKIDAVYIALPNTQHCEFTVRAAQAGIHVLCEKPMATSEDECQRMLDACRTHQVKLMIAYRLHFEEANLRTIEKIRAGEIGDPRIFTSTFSEPVATGNVRLRKRLGGGTLWDIGIYCINAARYLFQEEPLEAVGFSHTGADPRFHEVEENFGATLKFPGGKIATFTCGFGAVGASEYSVLGTQGEIRLNPAYRFDAELVQYTRVGEKEKKARFARRDQFGPEILYFSDCIQNGLNPEPSGQEGLADVRIILALYAAAASGKSVSLRPTLRAQRPTLEQNIHEPPVKEAKLFHADQPAA